MSWYQEVKKLLRPVRERDVGGSSCRSDVKCREAVERMFEYLDGELEDATREQVAEHFRVCSSCYPALAFEESFREALRRVQEGEQTPPAVRDRILAALENEGYTPS